MTSYSRGGGLADYDPWGFMHLKMQVASGSDNENNSDTSAVFQTAVEF